MTSIHYNANQIWLQLVKNQDKLNILVVAILAVLLLAYAAELTWRLLPLPEQKQRSTTSLSSTVNPSPSKQINLSAVKQLNLFGDAQAKPEKVEPTITSAPETRLNLTLTGVVANADAEQGAAIIENRSQQQTYGVGEKIEGTNATLKEVYADRVIIKNDISHETLMLDGEKFSEEVRQPAPQPKPVRAPSSNRRSLSTEALQASNQLQSQPSSFADFISVSPHRPDGELVGYRVRPGKSPLLFTEVGLITGDIITSINGLDLTDLQQSIEAMNMLKQLESLQMTLIREDELLTIYLDLPEQGEDR